MKKCRSIIYIAVILVSLCSEAFALKKYESVPGVVIKHQPKSTGIFIGSPSICILPDGSYVVSSDEFGPKSSEYKSAKSHIYKSIDMGESWTHIATLNGQFWSTLFYVEDNLYIMGTNKHHGNVIIRRSTDGGKTWSIPYDSKNGLLLEGEYHTAPVPVLVYGNRIWRAVEYATAKTTKWGERYSAVMMSVPLHSDLLNAENWTRSNHLPFNKSYLDGKFQAWLEGNAVATKDGKVVNVLRVHAPELNREYCVITDVEEQGRKLSFDSNNFFEMPGASKKFTIRYDEKSGLYWSIVNYVLESDRGSFQINTIRNTLALVSSKDLKQWKVVDIVLTHTDPYRYGFQYVDWAFEGDDIIFVSRTAFDDEEGGSKRAHDANFLTFHRIAEFRKK